MIRFPPARIPLDPSTGIEPFPSANKGNTSDSLTLRGDKQIYYNGLLALQGKRFITDDGKYIEILKGHSGWAVPLFLLGWRKSMY